MNQATFVNVCVRTILQQYLPEKRESVLLVAHSMGAVVAQYALALGSQPGSGLKQGPGSVHTIIALNSPIRFAELVGDVINVSQRTGGFSALLHDQAL